MRRKPNFESDSSGFRYQDQNSPSCILMLLVTVLGYFVFSAISRVMSGYGSELDYVACFGVIIGLVGLYFLAEREKNQKKLERYNMRQQWKITSVFADVRIVNRVHYPASTNDDGYDIHFHSPSFYLSLEMTDDQRAVAPNQTVIRVKVYGDIFEKLKNRDTVRIYYNSEAPLTFLLEEEI